MKNNSNNILFNITIFILFSVGILFIFSPIILYWLVHGNYDRYLWIINGPFPFSHLGGGPFQMVLYGTLLFVGILFICISFALRKNNS